VCVCFKVIKSEVCKPHLKFKVKAFYLYNNNNNNNNNLFTEINSNYKNIVVTVCVKCTEYGLQLKINVNTNNIK